MDIFISRVNPELNRKNWGNEEMSNIKEKTPQKARKKTIPLDKRKKIK